MSVSIHTNDLAEIQVAAGHKLILRVHANDPSGISKIFVQCYQFSITNTNRVKLAVGAAIVPVEESYTRTEFEVPVHIPENAALGKWGIQMIEFTNGRGYKTSFYRGQGKFDNLVFEVISPPTKEDALLRFEGIEISAAPASEQNGKG